MVGLDEVIIVETVGNSGCMKYKESTHVAYLTNPISQPGLDISPIWIFLVRNEGIMSQRKSVSPDKFFIDYYKVLVTNFQLLLHRWRSL
jgi:hypothetical protein